MSHAKPILSLSFSSDSILLASSDQDGTLKIWKYSKGKCLKTFKTPIYPIGSIQFAEDNSKLYAASFEGSVLIYSLQTDNLLQTIKCDHAISQMVLFNGLLYVSSAQDGIFSIYNPNQTVPGL